MTTSLDKKVKVIIVVILFYYVLQLESLFCKVYYEFWIKKLSLLVFYFIRFCNLKVHFVKFFKSFTTEGISNIISMISHFISGLKPMVDYTRDHEE